VKEDRLTTTKIEEIEIIKKKESSVIKFQERSIALLSKKGREQFLNKTIISLTKLYPDNTIYLFTDNEELKENNTYSNVIVLDNPDLDENFNRYNEYEPLLTEKYKKWKQSIIYSYAQMIKQFSGKCTFLLTTEDDVIHNHRNPLVAPTSIWNKSKNCTTKENNWEEIKILDKMTKILDKCMIEDKLNEKKNCSLEIENYFYDFFELKKNEIIEEVVIKKIIIKIETYKKALIKIDKIKKDSKNKKKENKNCVHDDNKLFWKQGTHNITSVEITYEILEKKIQINTKLSRYFIIIYSLIYNIILSENYIGNGAVSYQHNCDEIDRLYEYLIFNIKNSPIDTLIYNYYERKLKGYEMKKPPCSFVTHLGGKNSSKKIIGLEEKATHKLFPKKYKNKQNQNQNQNKNKINTKIIKTIKSNTPKIK